MCMTDVQVSNSFGHSSSRLLERTSCVSAMGFKWLVQGDQEAGCGGLGATQMGAEATGALQNRGLPWNSCSTILAWQRSTCMLLQMRNTCTE